MVGVLICEVNYIAYNDLVKQFYANLRMIKDYAKSIVNDTHFAFDIIEINELFGIPNEKDGFCRLKTQSHSLIMMICRDPSLEIIIVIV